jgi:hypothetical protein
LSSSSVGAKGPVLSLAEKASELKPQKQAPVKHAFLKKSLRVSGILIGYKGKVPEKLSH